MLDLYFSRARMYNPKLGRFLGRDPLGGGCCGNNYSYACNRPLLFSDPLGLSTVLFKGFHKAKKTEHLVVTEAARVLNGLNPREEAVVYDHRKYRDAFTNLVRDVEGFKDENCQYPLIHVGGYSCGTDSALYLVRAIEDWVKNSGIKGLYVRNLIYVDFNWGTVHYNDSDGCRHETHGEYRVPDIVPNRWHFVSTGKMKYGCSKNWTYGDTTCINPGCSITIHTSKLWEAYAKYTEDGMTRKEMEDEAVWKGPKAGWDAVLNTSGFYTAGELQGEKYGWPGGETGKFEQLECGGMDHFGLGNDKGVARQIARFIRSDVEASQICK